MIDKVVFFVTQSWTYLGCDSGTGRWRARRDYFINIIPKTIKFAYISRNDPPIPRRNRGL
jgi:hypothetical protein